ncbi:MAG: hypothetical protein OCU12_06135 [Methanophagales archaeon]|nr:hypothetical protein [Methanophagales archaeon]
MSEPKLKLNTAYQGYANVTEEEALARFREKFGYEPEVVMWSGPILLAGPIKTHREGGDNYDQDMVCIPSDSRANAASAHPEAGDY